MKTLLDFTRLTAISACVLVGGLMSFAQGYYDDDIYFDASKQKKETKKTAVQKQPQQKAVRQQPAASQQFYYDGAQYVPWNNVGEFQSADAYQPEGTSTRDVDEYNRRTPSAQQSKAVPDSITLQQFEEMSNTRNLARFHGSEEAQAAYADNTGMEAYDYTTNNPHYYTQQPSTTVVNLNLVGGYGYPYYGNSWYWNRWGWGYDPYWGYDPFWGPSWSYYPSWSWGWGPSWGWSWGGPSWSWGWGWGGPSWSWGWGGPGPGWHHPVMPGRPHYTSSGAFAPNTTHRPSGSGVRNNSLGRYVNGGSANRSSAAGSLGTRPSAGGAAGVNRGNATSTSRPGYRAPISVPSGVTNGASGTRGRQVGTQSAPTQQRVDNRYDNNSNRNNNNSFNSGSSRGRSSSSGSFGSGGSRGGFSGGGATRGGGGGGGRRGR